jgi:ribosomal protein L10
MANHNITFLQTEKFFQSYPIILLFQHNNLNVTEWSKLRIHLQEFDNTSIFLLKNTVAEQVLFNCAESKIELNSVNIFNSKKKINIFQGPSFGVGFFKQARVRDILKKTTLYSNVILIGGIINNQLINHLDIIKLSKLNKDIYSSFLINCHQSKVLHNLLRNSININVVDQVLLDFLGCLELLKIRKNILYM